MKTVVIFHRLGPYHFARLRAAGRLLPVTAIETSGADETYAWDLIAGADGFERVTLFEHADAQKQPVREVARRIMAALNQIRPQVVVIPGWADSAALGALRWCGQNRVPAAAMSESTEWDNKRNGWREAVKRRIVGLCSAALAGGRPHRDYLVKLGMPAERIFLGYDAVDNEYFAAGAARARSQEPGARSQHGLPEKYFLASARFVGKKNLSRLIEAYARYRLLCEDHGRRTTDDGQRRTDDTSPRPSPQSGEGEAAWDLVLLGDGPLRSSILNLRSSLGLDDHVHLPGFKQYPELPAYYGLAGAFIHASTTEQWGLVVNEAMASGLPVLVSQRCGCAMDLVTEGVNGFTFDPYNVEEMAQLMLRISDFGFWISDFGAASRQIIAQWGPERFASGLKQAAECALRVGPANPTLLQSVILKALLWK